jgi:hypothetical protein
MKLTTIKPIPLTGSCQMTLTFTYEPKVSEPDICDTVIDPRDHDQDLSDSCIQDSHVLPAELQYHGFQYTLVCRGLRTYVYHQTLGKQTIGYEVFMIRIQPEAVLNGKSYLARERWPKDEDFSKTAWSCWTLEEAMLKFNALES